MTTFTFTCYAFGLLGNPPALALTVVILAAGYLMFGLEPSGSRVRGPR